MSSEQNGEDDEDGLAERLEAQMRPRRMTAVQKRILDMQRGFQNAERAASIEEERRIRTAQAAVLKERGQEPPHVDVDSRQELLASSLHRRHDEGPPEEEQPSTDEDVEQVPSDKPSTDV